MGQTPKIKINSRNFTYKVVTFTTSSLVLELVKARQ
uniref:Uncharacterized protein n=1 Tax=viral metagenome TaxID=1070528 RepID=A0A6C0IM65_9ZZZZ